MSDNKKEKFNSTVTTSISNEAIQTLGNLYNKQNMTVSNLNVTSFNIMPTGMIVVWNDPLNIPAGWVLCDGNNGTPDLRGKFIVGSDTELFGNKTSGGRPQVTLSIDELPSHTHQYNDIYYSKTDGTVDIPGNLGSIAKADYNNVGWQMHTNMQSTGSGNPISLMPPYYSLVYIMKS